MQIVYIVYGRDIGGGEIVCLQQMRASRERGHDVCLLVPDEGSTADAARREGFEVEVFPLKRTFHFHRAVQFALWLKKRHIDLVHTHTTLEGMVLSRLGAWLAGVPIICHHHTGHTYNSNPVIRYLQRQGDNLTAAISTNLAVSEDTRRSRVLSGNPARKISVLPNGVHLHFPSRHTDVPDIRQIFAIPVNASIVGCVARLAPAKGQTDLIWSISSILSRTSDVHLVLVGADTNQGEYQQELSALAAGLGIAEKVHFTGYWPDASKLIDHFDIFVLPSYREAMPMSILEAMAAAKPVIATHVNGVPEVVIDGVTGILVPPGDPKALADAILRLLHDPDLARRMGAAGRARVEEHFNLDRLNEQLFQIYDQVVAKHRGQNRR
ncbi:MAG: glycosyltransferase family 4 protein [Anaerolinea sp.]|nr:glycosyltransferase family 4 protein [Anaerolinea sp.]